MSISQTPARSTSELVTHSSTRVHTSCLLSSCVSGGKEISRLSIYSVPRSALTKMQKCRQRFTCDAYTYNIMRVHNSELSQKEIRFVTAYTRVRDWRQLESKKIVGYERLSRPVVKFSLIMNCVELFRDW